MALTKAGTSQHFARERPHSAEATAEVHLNSALLFYFFLLAYRSPSSPFPVASLTLKKQISALIVPAPLPLLAASLKLTATDPTQPFPKTSINGVS